MNQLPQDPQTPANKGQILAVAIASTITGIGFLAFATWVVALNYESGRLRLPSLVFLICGMAILGLGFLAIAFFLLRDKKKRGAKLMGGSMLYLAGGFIFVLPLLALILTLTGESSEKLSSVIPCMSLSAFGVLVIRLARIRGRKNSGRS